MVDMFHINRGVILIVLVLMSGILLLSAHAQYTTGCLPTASGYVVNPPTPGVCRSPSPQEPCGSYTYGGDDYPQWDCGLIAFSLGGAYSGSTATVGSSPAVSWVLNSTTGDGSGLGGCSYCTVLIVYVPPGNDVVFNNGASLNHADLQPCPTPTSGNPYPTGVQCIAAEISDQGPDNNYPSQGVGGSVLTTQVATETFYVYIANSTACSCPSSFSDVDAQVCWPNIEYANPVNCVDTPTDYGLFWIGVNQISIVASSSSSTTTTTTTTTVTPTAAFYVNPDRAIPGAAVNITTVVSGLPGGTTGSGFASQIYFAIISSGSSSTGAPGCPSGLLSASGLQECVNPNEHYSSESQIPYYAGQSCWQATSEITGGVTTGYAPWSEGVYSGSASSGYTFYPTGQCTAGGTECSIWTLTGFDQPSYNYNWCAYYSPTGTEGSAQYIGGGSGSPYYSSYTISSYTGSYGLPMITSPIGFQLGNSTVASASAAEPPFTSQSAVMPNICGTGTGTGTVPNGVNKNGQNIPDACAIEFAGLEPSAQCEQPYAIQEGAGGGPNTGYWYNLIPYCNPNLAQNIASGTLPCILNGYSNDTYQNQNNISYSQPVSTQYLSNGDYLLCMYDYSDVHWLDWTYPPLCENGGCSSYGYGGFMTSLFFGTESIDCYDGICGSTSSVGPPYTPPPCVGCGLSITPGGIGPNTANALQLNAFAGTACGVYGTIDIILFLFALVLALLGAALYMGSSLLPYQARGAAQSYAFGFILVAIIAVVIAGVSVWALSIAGDTNISNVLSLCK